MVDTMAGPSSLNETLETLWSGEASSGDCPACVACADVGSAVGGLWLLLVVIGIVIGALVGSLVTSCLIVRKSATQAMLTQQQALRQATVTSIDKPAKLAPPSYHV